MLINFEKFFCSFVKLVDEKYFRIKMYVLLYRIIISERAPINVTELLVDKNGYDNWLKDKSHDS